VQDVVDNRKNSFEFLGYDFMVDEDLKVWLIEVNSSPSMDHSTVVFILNLKLFLSFTIASNNSLSKTGTNNLPKVILDYPKAKKKSKCDTGGFVLCHKAKF